MFGWTLARKPAGERPPTAPDIGDGETKRYEVEGRCLFESGDEQPCLVTDLTVTSFQVIGLQVDRIGSGVICYIDQLGIVPGLVETITPQGFIVRPTVPAQRRERFQARVDWHRKRAGEAADLRAAPRIVPKRTSVTVHFGDRLSFTARIENVSMTGAALALNPACRPFVGSLVRVGRQSAHVVRLTPTGIAVQFVTAIKRDLFNADIAL